MDILIKSGERQNGRCVGCIEEYLDIADVIYIGLDLNGSITLLNKKGCQILGVEEDEVVGKNWFDTFVIAENKKELKDYFSKLINNGQQEQNGQFENAVKTAHGYKKIISWQNKVMKDDHGNPIGVVSSGVDVTEQRQVEEALQNTKKQYSDLYNNIPIGIYRTTPDGRVLLANTTLINMLGYSSMEELTSINLEDEGYSPSYSRDEFTTKLEREGKIIGFEAVWLCKDGSELHVRENAKVVRDENGEIAYYEGTVEDVTDLKNAMKASVTDRELLQSLMDNIPDTIYFKDTESRFTRINKAQQEVLGLDSTDDAIGKSDFDFFTKEHAQSARDDELGIIQTGEPLISRVEQIRRADGEYRWVTATKVPIKNEDGEVTGLVGISRDVTKQKELEDALQDSEEKYRTVVENMLDGLCIIEEGTIKFANNAFISIFGYPEDELIGHGFEKFLAPEDRELVVERYEKRLRGEDVPSEYEFSIVRPDSSKAIVRIRVALTKFRSKTATVVSLRDVTEEKRAEELRTAIYRISESAHTARNLDDLYTNIHRILQGLMSAKNLYIALYDSESDLVEFPYYSDQFSEPPMPRTRGKGITEFVIRYNKPYLASEQDFQALLENGEVVIRGKHPEDWLGVPLKKDKETIGVLAVQNYDTDFHYSERDKNILSFVSDQIAMAIVRKQTQSALAAERERLAVTLRSIGDGVISTDIEGRILLMNRMAEELTGWSMEDAVSKPLSEVFCLKHAKTGEEVIPDIKGVMQSNDVRTLPKEVKLADKQGQEKFIADSIAPLRDPDSKVIGSVLVFRDVTEQLHLEEEALKARKLESIGILAGGIAHDFNNILSGILGNISLAKMTIDDTEKATNLMNEAENASKRAAKLTKQLLTFSKGGAPVKEKISLQELLSESVEFALRGSNVREKMVIQDGLWNVEVDPGQIDQVMQNLILNADQAMPEGGMVLIQCENITIDTSSTITGLRPGNYVKIIVQDHGSGISAANLERIFDPYFTTKESGHGLGLSTCYSIIQKHGGHIIVDSKEDQGTTMTVYIPAVSEAQDSAARTAILHDDSGSGESARNARILVMDDDETVQQVAEKMLVKLGYDVVLAPDGETALQVYQEATEEGIPFDAVILDLTIPGGMGGKTTIQKLLEYDPGVVGIVSSGYSTDPILASHEQYGFAGKVSKPYDIAELANTVSDVLE